MASPEAQSESFYQREREPFTRRHLLFLGGLGVLLANIDELAATSEADTAAALNDMADNSPDAARWRPEQI